MNKIIEIDDTVIRIGAEDGGIVEARTCDINFVPHIGDEVEIFKTETRVIVSKVEKPSIEIPNGGININVQSSANNAGAPQYATNGTKAVNKVVYCLLAIFLGGLGVHKFYAGKIGTGVVYLLFVWTFIPSFIAFVEFIIAICKPADSAGNILV